MRKGKGRKFALVLMQMKFSPPVGLLPSPLGSICLRQRSPSSTLSTLQALGIVEELTKTKNTLKKLWPFSASTTRSMPWWCFSSQTMPGWLWPSDFVFWSCLGTFTSHCNPTLYLPLLTPGERFISQETPCQFSRNSWRRTTLKSTFRLPTIFVSTTKLSGIYLSKV